MKYAVRSIIPSKDEQKRSHQILVVVMDGQFETDRFKIPRSGFTLILETPVVLSVDVVFSCPKLVKERNKSKNGANFFISFVDVEMAFFAHSTRS